MGLRFHLASKMMEWREKRRKGSARSFLQGASDEETWPAVGAALPRWQTTGNGDGACLREKERGARASASAGREGESWVGGQRMK